MQKKTVKLIKLHRLASKWRNDDSNAEETCKKTRIIDRHILCRFSDLGSEIDAINKENDSFEKRRKLMDLKAKSWVPRNINYVNWRGFWILERITAGQGQIHFICCFPENH